MPDTARREQRVLVFAPTGRDAVLICKLVASMDVSSLACGEAGELFREIETGAGAVILPDEALPPEVTSGLLAALGSQPAWSDLPLIVFTRGGESSERLIESLAPLGNTTILERRVRLSTLISAVKAALRARFRQYEVRDLLQRQGEADRRKDEFLAMLGHELRNPLAAIRNALFVLDQVDGKEERSARQREVILRQTQHLVRMVDDLLPPGPARQRPSEPAAELHVLVVEDNRDGRESLRELLEIWGHTVSVAEDGPEGLEKAFSLLPDVALIDIGLPGLDGNEVARGIRSILGARAISLIAMTGYGQPEDRRRALQAGFDFYLVKPVDPTVLAKLLEENRRRGDLRQAAGSEAFA